MKTIQTHCPDWGLVYLGGCFETRNMNNYERKVSPKDRVDDVIVKGKRVYQTHGYLIRRTIARDILSRLRSGQAADAALVSWCRGAPSRCFKFHPRQLLLQTGGSQRRKDSDIFVEGIAFQQKAEQAAARKGRKYVFAPKFRNRTLRGK